MEILDKAGNFGQKSKYWAKMKILDKMEILDKNGNFGQKSKYWAKILRNNRIRQKLKCYTKIQILEKSNF